MSHDWRFFFCFAGDFGFSIEEYFSGIERCWNRFDFTFFFDSADEWETSVWLTVRHCNIWRWSRRVCRVELDFQQFEMIQENNCLLNHFEIGGQHLCGNQTGRKSEYTSHYLRLDKLMWSMNELTLFLCFFVSFSSFPSGNWLSSIRANHTIAALTRKSSESVDRRETDAMPLVTWDKLTRAYYFFPRYLPLLSIQNPQPFDMVPYVIWME